MPTESSGRSPGWRRGAVAATLLACLLIAAFTIAVDRDRYRVETDEATASASDLNVAPDGGPPSVDDAGTTPEGDAGTLVASVDRAGGLGGGSTSVSASSSDSSPEGRPDPAVSSSTASGSSPSAGLGGGLGEAANGGAGPASSATPPLANPPATGGPSITIGPTTLRPTTAGPSTTRRSTTTGPAATATTADTRRSTTASTAAASTTTGNPGTPAAAAYDFGFSPGGWFPDEPDATLFGDLDRMVEAGATWIRIDFDWSEIEANRGTYHWHRTDRVVDAARARGLRVLALLGESPSWARPSGLDSHAPPVDPGNFATFAADAVERYRSRGVVAWELWNEPNLGMFWSPTPDPEAYADLVVPTVAAMRAVDPGVRVISGGLAPAADEPDGSGISPETFTSEMVNAGADVFDGYAIHPYSYPARPIDPATAEWNPFTNLPRFRELLRSLGQGGKPIWLTEYGAPTGTSSRAVSESEQSAQITEALAAADGWSWVGPLFLYSHRDLRNAPGDFQSNFGLRRNNGSPKQAWTDLLTLAGR